MPKPITMRKLIRMLKVKKPNTDPRVALFMKSNRPLN